MNKSIEELIYEETEERLKEMSSPDYKWPKKANGADYFWIVVSMAICIILILLCVGGVIV